MTVRLITLDLDGTLLTSDKRVSERNIRAVKSCIEKGIYVVPATGRTKSGLPDALREIPGVRYIISANGASVEDMETGGILVRRSIFWKDAMRIIDLVRPYPVMYDSYIEGMGKIENRFLETLGEYVKKPELIKLIRNTRTGLPDLKEFIGEHHPAVDKINVTFKEEDTRKKLRGILEAEQELSVASSVPNNLELNSKEASKGSGLKFLTEYLHLKQEETMAFGDEENDLSMIMQAGFGVAMENAVPAVKAQADFVTDSNDDDGVASAIEKFVLSF